MKPAKQSHDFCACLEGLTLPSGVIYGNVSRVSYYYNPEVKKLSIYDKYVKKWRFANPDKYPLIMHYIHAFMRGTEYRPEKVRWCQHKQETRDKLFSAGIRAAEQHKKTTEKIWRAVLPQEKRAQAVFTRYDGSCYSQRAIDGKMYQPSDFGENATVYNEDGITVWNDRGYKLSKNGKVTKQENPFPIHGDENRPLLNAENPNSNFYDNGEKVVTITKRDGMAINQKKVRPEKAANREFKVSRNGEKFTVRETVEGGKSTVKRVD